MTICFVVAKDEHLPKMPLAKQYNGGVIDGVMSLFPTSPEGLVVYLYDPKRKNAIVFNVLNLTVIGLFRACLDPRFISFEKCFFYTFKKMLK